MELEKLREFIKNAEEFKTNPACQELAVHFESLIELMELTKGNKEILDSAFFERFGNTFKQFWDSFDRAVASFGVPPEILKANLENPEFFHPEQWKIMMMLKQEILGQEAARPKKFKKEKKKKSVRI